MKSDEKRFLLRKEILNGAIVILGVLLLLVLFFQPGTAAVSANFTVKNQADMTLFSGNHSGALSANYSCNDILYCNDISSWNETDTIGWWNWTVEGVDRPPINVKANSNITVDTTTSTFSDPITVRLVASNQTGLNSSSLTVDFYKYGPCGNITADMIPVAAYDDRALNPNGTVTFYDNSYSKIDPELNITKWWWKGTNTQTGEEKNLTGKSQFTMNMSRGIVPYIINLTVGGNGNYTTISKTYNIPPDNVMPIANFSVVPMAGIGPMNVSVIDQSKSMVNYTMSNVSLFYDYKVYNSTGVLIDSDDSSPNPVFNLKYPGTYNITSRVTNWYGVSDETSVENIMVYPGGLVANFSSSVREGLAPLNFTLIDQSIGEGPLAYNWTIGNSTWTSERRTEHNPQFKVPYTGKYWVNLSIIDQHGETDYENKTDFINVGVQRYPTADFAAVPENGTCPFNVSFIDLSVLDPELLAVQVIPNYTWTFDDGGSSHEKNPTHLYTEPGDYNVSLFVQHGDQQYSTDNVQANSVNRKEHMVHVYEPSSDAVNFTWVQEYGKTAYSAVLIPLGITADWQTNWVVEKDGTPYSPVDASAFTPRYDLPGTGIYTVTLTASQTGLSPVSITQQMEIFPRVRPDNEMTMMNTNSASLMDKDKVWAYGYPGDPIQFWSNKSNSMEDSWLWDFGDNSSSPLRSPLHTYNAPGLYTVTLKSSNVKGETIADIDQLPYIPYDQNIVTDTYNVWILHNLDVNPVGIPPSGVAPLPVQFSETVSVNGKSDAVSREYVNRWYWDFDYDQDKYLNVYDYNYEKPDAFAGETDPVYPILYTGEGASVEEAPSYTYKKPGVYHPVLWVQLKKDYWSWHPFRVNDITVLGTLKPAFTYEIIDRDGTYGYSYKFMDTSESACINITSWDWDFGDGTPHSTEPAPTHLYKEPGIYTVTLSVCDDCVPQNCGSTSENIRVVYDGQPALAADFASNPIASEPYTVQFTDQSVGPVPLTYKWNFASLGSSSDKNPKFKFPSSGTYLVNLTISDLAGYSNTSLKNVIVDNEPLKIDVEFAGLKIDNKPMTMQFIDQSVGGVPVAYLWDFGDNSQSIDRSPNHTFSSVGTYDVNLTVTDVYSNKYSKNNSVTVPSVKPPVAGFGYSINPANPLYVEFKDSSSGEVYSWKWIFGDGFGSSISSPGHSYSEAGTYTVNLTVGNGMGTSTTSLPVTVQ